MCTQHKESGSKGDRDERQENRVQDSFYYTTCAVDRWW